MRIAVTGSSRGIGAAICRDLTACGHEIVHVARTYSRDVTSPDLEAWLEAEGRVDGIITCAGFTPQPQPLISITDDEWQASLDVNLTHHLRAIRWFAKQGVPGPIVVVASTAGTRPSPEWIPYAAAKAGLINLGLSAHAELGPLGFRVYVVAPGRCATALRATLVPDEDPESIMQPSEVATAVRRLLGDADGVLTGQVIRIARP